MNATSQCVIISACLVAVLIAGPMAAALPGALSGAIDDLEGAADGAFGVQAAPGSQQDEATLLASYELLTTARAILARLEVADAEEFEGVVRVRQVLVRYYEFAGLHDELLAEIRQLCQYVAANHPQGATACVGLLLDNADRQYDAHNYALAQPLYEMVLGEGVRPSDAETLRSRVRLALIQLRRSKKVANIDALAELIIEHPTESSSASALWELLALCRDDRRAVKERKLDVLNALLPHLRDEEWVDARLHRAFLKMSLGSVAAAQAEVSEILSLPRFMTLERQRRSAQMYLTLCSTMQQTSQTVGNGSRREQAK